MAIETAKLEAVFTANTKDFDKGVKRVSKGMGELSKDLGSGLKSIGSGISGLGANILGMTAPLAAGFGVAIKSAMDFDATMTNIGAVMGKTKDEMKGLSAEILAIGSENTFGVQATAEAFYDIVGGVTDASARMDILSQSIATAEAGQASLAGTTSAMISVMNSYAFSAEQAGYASDVMTQTIAMGVGTMDELAGALPQVAGLAASLGISFDEVGGSLAYLSTKGFSFSQAGTQLRAMMTALLNPNEKMKAALSELGYETGAALIETEGLVGAYQQLASTGMAEKEFAAMLGSTEALTGATALLSTEAGGATKFLNDFGASLAGATEQARNTQLESATAQFNLLKSQVGALAITIGQALLPILNDLVVGVTPAIESFSRWASENPGTVQTIAQLVAIVGGLATVAIPIGGIITGMAAAFGVLTSPVTVTIGLFVGLAAAINGVIQSWNNWQNLVTNTPKELLSPEGFSRLQAGLGIAANQSSVMGLAGVGAGAVFGVKGKARGGDIPSGWSGWVGENGPEWVSNNRGAKTVFSNPMTPGGNNYGGRMVGAGASGGVTITGNITINGVQNVQQLFDQLRKIGNQRGG